MTSFGSLGIGLSFLFGCMVMGFVAELYYLLWVKKRISKRATEDQIQYTTYASELCSLFSWKKTSSNSLSKICTQEVTRIQEINDQDQDLELGTSNNDDVLLEGYREDIAESELMRLHNLRFLSTIKEETKEDLESDDGKSRKGSRTSRSFSDLTLILTPLSSPPVKSQPSDFSFNPLFESEINGHKSSSPPPKFKFLRDAEEKLIRRLIEETESRKVLSDGQKSSSNSTVFNEEGSFVSFQKLPVHHSASVHILPLASSPNSA
ncbi:uncharacterized protein LOC132605879 [Lycium barbarum]|uniref:uncharacterized protein LOC132605879 n=1 Tax=Lycium barbarum TaxID=112863 RepID=UPI00293E57C9|nr:uncharacterized protein LOC132605879 [Lycium barbarum]